MRKVGLLVSALLMTSTFAFFAGFAKAATFDAKAIAQTIVNFRNLSCVSDKGSFLTGYGGADISRHELQFETDQLNDPVVVA